MVRSAASRLDASHVGIDANINTGGRSLWDQLLLAEDTVPPAAFTGAAVVPIPASEAYAANVVAVGSQVLVAAGYPRTAEILRAMGYTVIPLDLSEIRRADGALTCMSIRW